MSYFMTITGAPYDVPSIVGIELISADDSQDYVRTLASELEYLDGKPVCLVHDGETGTSDIIIADLESALLNGGEVADLPAAKLLEVCFRDGKGFRIWWANNDPRAFIANVSAVANLTEAYAAIKAQRGATWRPSA